MDHSLSIPKGKCLREMSEVCFLKSLLRTWNVLLGVVVEASTIVVFKILLDRHMDIEGLEGYR